MEQYPTKDNLPEGVLIRPWMKRPRFSIIDVACYMIPGVILGRIIWETIITRIF